MYGFLFQWIKDNIKKDEGQTMAEYGILLGLITAAVIGIIALIGVNVTAKFQSVYDALTAK
jgi:Flp pilus assembly pilin Flp